MPGRQWFDRKFDLGLPPEHLPDVVERLRGTPLRLRERAAQCPAERLHLRREGGWSVVEQVGHLTDLEHLWLGRLDDFVAGAAVLRPADLENRATWDAKHNDRSIGDHLDRFEALREVLVRRVEEMGADEPLRSSLHPRLDQPMTVVDLAFFVAEHDDHHLAAITALSGALS
jgi:uncharacterized damage-inducible protein DinB